jgi:CRP-like cAMP-binding protein
MNTDNLISFFKNSSLISSGTAEEIACRFSIIEIAKNELLLKEGVISNQYLFLESGFIRSFAHDVDGNEVTTNFYQPASVVFEVSSFFNRTPSKENIQALTDCTGLYITYAELNDLFHGLQEFREFGRQILVRGFSSLKDRMLSMITETAEERYNKLLLTKPEIFQHAPLKYIASYLGITDTSLSRIRKEFSKKHTA